jgi:hypothetical protein
VVKIELGHVHRSRLAALALFAVLSCRRPKAAPEDPMHAATLALAHVEADADAGLPDWVLTAIEQCYADGLVVHAEQRGELAFALRAAPVDGGVALSAWTPTGSLDADVAACARGVLEGEHRGWGGPKLQPVSATLRLVPIQRRGPAPPTEAALRDFLDRTNADMGGVVRIAKLTVTHVHQLQNGLSISRVFEYSEEVEFVKDGFEIACQRVGGVFKTFVPKLVPRPDPCETEPHHAGDRAVSESWWQTTLTEQGWESRDDLHYCGDRVCPAP